MNRHPELATLQAARPTAPATAAKPVPETLIAERMRVAREKRDRKARTNPLTAGAQS